MGKNEISKKWSKYEEVRGNLCKKYDKKCLTQKCPLAKYGCYDYVTMSQFLKDSHPKKKKEVIQLVKEAAKEFDIDL